MTARLTNLCVCVLFVVAMAGLSAPSVCQAGDKVELQLKVSLQQEEDVANLPYKVTVLPRVFPIDAQHPGIPGKVQFIQKFILDGVVLKQRVTEYETARQSVINEIFVAQSKERLSGKILLYVDGVWVKDNGIFYPDRPGVDRVLKMKGLLSGVKKDDFKVTGDKVDEEPKLKEVQAEQGHRHPHPTREEALKLQEVKYEFELTIPARGVSELSFQGKDSAGNPFTLKYTVQSYPELVYKEGKVELRPGDIFLVPIAAGDKKVVVTGEAGTVEQVQEVGATGNYVVLKAKAAGKAAISIENAAGAKRDILELTVKPDAERTKPEYVKLVAR